MTTQQWPPSLSEFDKAVESRSSIFGSLGPTVVLATPNQTSMTLSESHGYTGRPLVHLHSTGDILLTAPNGRVHIQSLIFTQEISNPADNGIEPWELASGFEYVRSMDSLNCLLVAHLKGTRLQGPGNHLAGRASDMVVNFSAND